MNLLKKVFLIFLASLIIFGCSNSSGDDENETNAKENEDTKGTQVEFLNETEFCVDIFSDSTHTAKLATIAEKKSAIIEKCEYKETGNVFYIAYNLDINGITIPYGKGECIIKLTENSRTKVSVPKPTQTNVEHSVILLRNDSDNGITISSKSTEIFPYGTSSSLVNPAKNAVYLFDKDEVSKAGEFKIVKGTSSARLFEEDAKTEVGKIYSIIYDGKSSQLISVSPFDPSVKKQIWTISTSSERGKTFHTGFAAPRENISDGYMVFGKLCQDLDSSNSYGVPFYAKINANGEITTQKRFPLADKPDLVDFTSGVEKNGTIFCVASTSWEGKSEEKAVLIKLGERDSYKDIGIEGCLKNDPITLAAKNENTLFALLSTIETENSKENTVLVKLSVSGNSVSSEKIWESSDENANSYACSIAYCEDSGLIGILIQKSPLDSLEGTKSEIVITDENGTEKGTLPLDDYLLDKIIYDKASKSLFASGSFISQLTGLEEAAFVKTNPETVQLDWEPKTYPASGSDKVSNFRNIMLDGDSVILSGFTEATARTYEGGYPYIVSYNMKKNSVNWSRTYSTLPGWYAYNCFASSIGTPFIELYNDKNGKSSFCSTGFFGEIEDAKDVVPNKIFSETVTYTPKGTPETPQSEDSTQTTEISSEWNFQYGTNAACNATILGYGSTPETPPNDIEIEADSGSGASLVLLGQEYCAVKYNNGLQWSSIYEETDVIRITTREACTLDIVGKGTSGAATFTTEKPNSFSVNGLQIYLRTDIDDTDEKIWTVNLNSGENIISVSGMKFFSFTCR